MKKVLIALDYDPTAQKVAEAGYSLAEKMGAETILLHVISDPVYYSSTRHSQITGISGFVDIGQLQLDGINSLKKASQEFLDQSKYKIGDEKIQTRVEEGDFAESILRAAKDLHAELIVMGSHSQKWLENIVMGSVTEKVLHHTSIPLLIIPTKKVC